MASPRKPSALAVLERSATSMLREHEEMLREHEAQEMEALQTVVELGRKAREAKDISLKKPVVDMVVVVSNEVQRAGLTKLQNYLCR